MIGSLIGLLFALIIVGVLAWGAWRLIAMVPMAEPFRIIAIVVLVILCVLIVWNFLPPLINVIPHGRALN
jgi:hypothetical protein